jgi:hypothetical protein
MKNPVTAYWMKHYTSAPGPEGRCTLCGNSGLIDTRNTARDASGRLVGRISPCICPNGQAERADQARSQRLARARKDTLGL